MVVGFYDGYGIKNKRDGKNRVVEGFFFKFFIILLRDDK